MNATTNSALVWKRMASENQQSARMLARLSILLFLLLIMTGAYAYSSHARYNDLCHTIESNSRKATVPTAQILGESLASNYCS